MRHVLLAGVAVAAILVPATVRGADDAEAPPPKPKIVFSAPVTRPAALSPLYVSLAGLQAYDGYATLRGVASNDREANALVGGLTHQPAAFWAVKAASTAVTVVLAERLWRTHHRREAILTMVVANSVMGMVAARNASVLHASR
jgi:uncharacterized protein DUF5658